jgi:16S rRNA (cytosine967-C5)-methyltransferase
LTIDSGRHRPKAKAKPQNSQPHRANEPDKPGYRARAAAAKMLSAVIEQKTPLDGMIDEDHGNPAFRALSPQDRGLVRAILNSALRHQAWIDAIFDSFLDKPLPEGARHLRHILSVAAAQILFLDIPDHSAVDIAVEQARHDPRSSRFANLVNALLRRLAREKQEVLDKAKATMPVFPVWFQTRLDHAYGPSTTKAVGDSFLELAPIDLTVKDDPAHWAKLIGGTVLPTGTVRLDAFDGSVAELPGFAEGSWWVQDAAAAIPARLMGDIKGKRVADLCAAPGGKTAQLIVQGAEVTAVEQSASRIKRLKSNLERLGLAADLKQTKLEEFKPSELFDAILLDAPCSSTGTIRRHPDVLWTKGPADIEKLADVQYRLLDSALGLVKPGGRIVFSNCSLDPLEGEELIEKFLTAHADVERIAISKEDWPGLEEAVNARGEFRTTPAMLGGMDGFFAAVLWRK